MSGVSRDARVRREVSRTYEGLAEARHERAHRLRVELGRVSLARVDCLGKLAEDGVDGSVLLSLTGEVHLLVQEREDDVFLQNKSELGHL